MTRNHYVINAQDGNLGNWFNYRWKLWFGSVVSYSEMIILKQTFTLKAQRSLVHIKLFWESI